MGKGERAYDPDAILRGNAKQLMDTLVEVGLVSRRRAKVYSVRLGDQRTTVRRSEVQRWRLGFMKKGQ